MTGLISLFTAPEPREPKVFMSPLRFAEGLGDKPDNHRWRAQWATDFDGTVIGIELTAYPVVRLTPSGAWIDQYAYTQHVQVGDGYGQEWVTTDDRRLWKWVSNDGGQAWAKPTQEAAIHSIAIRLTRWAARLRADNAKLMGAVNALQVARPDLKRFADKASETLGRAA